MPKQLTNGSDVITVPDALVDRYTARGWAPVKTTAAGEAKADLDKMTIAKLRSYAAAHSIDLGGAERKADIQKAIRAAFAAAPGDARERPQQRA